MFIRASLIEKQKQILVADYNKTYNNKYICTIYTKKNGEAVEIDDFAQLIDQCIECPSILNEQYYAYTGFGRVSMRYLIEAASNLGLIELRDQLISQNHLTPLVQSRLLCGAIQNKQSEFVKFYISQGISATACDLALNLAQANFTIENSIPLMCPLAYAVQSNDVESAKLLIAAGASFDDLSYFQKGKFCPHSCTVWDLIKKEKLHPSEQMQVLIDEERQKYEIVIDTKSLRM